MIFLCKKNYLFEQFFFSSRYLNMNLFFFEIVFISKDNNIVRIWDLREKGIKRTFQISLDTSFDLRFLSG